MSTASLAPSRSAHLRPVQPGEAASAPARVEREHLRPLTSLRFVAASMIVVLHLEGAFTAIADWFGALNLAAGVPFFFILSGFILTHAYPRLDEAGTRRFFVARFARLWPVHATVVLLTVLAMAVGLRYPASYDTPTAALANLAMVHAWVPYPDSYFSFNAPSWSISTELGFYVLFPLLIWRQRWTWPIALIVSCLLLMGMVSLGQSLALPPSRSGTPGMDLSGLLNMNPLATMYLFVLGMTCCLIWRGLAPRLQIGVVIGTVLELVALVLAGWGLAAPTSLPGLVVRFAPWLGPTVLAWTPPILTIYLAFAGLIVVMALGQGLVSQLLSHPLPVRLGEISYAMYLVHYQVLLILLVGAWRPWLAQFPEPAVAVLYVIVTLSLAWALWRFVEQPARDSLRRAYRGWEYALTDRQWRLAVIGIVGVLMAILALRVATLR